MAKLTSRASSVRCFLVNLSLSNTRPTWKNALSVHFILVVLRFFSLSLSHLDNTSHIYPHSEIKEGGCTYHSQACFHLLH